MNGELHVFYLYVRSGAKLVDVVLKRMDLKIFCEEQEKEGDRTQFRSSLTFGRMKAVRGLGVFKSRTYFDFSLDALHSDNAKVAI
jgi:hypothetical protein